MAICPNCDSDAVGNYCPQCGQRYHAVHSIREFVRTVADDQVGVDAKLPRTLMGLFFKPGFLTREYMQGRIVRYIPPFRLYLLASVLFFVLLSFLSVRQDWGGAAGRELSQELDAARDSLARDSAAAASPRDSVAPAGGGLNVRISGEDGQWMDDVTVDMPWEWLNQKIEGNLRALGKLPPTEATRRITSAIIEQLPKVMFVLLPVFALLLKLLYVLRKRPYLEHFVFALHLHAFIFLLFIPVLVYRAPYVGGIVGATIALYTFLAMKRVYAQSYVMTFLKWSGLMISYMILASFGMVFALIWTFAAM